MIPEYLTPDDETRFQCRHIFTDGRRCGSPALHGPDGAENFCYFHHNSRRPIQDASTRRRRQSRFTLPSSADLSERSGIQLALSEVLQKIACNEIDPRRAGLLLYGLQIASLNLPKSAPREESIEPVSEVTLDPEHGLLAPPAELGHDLPKGSAQRLLEELDALDRERQSTVNLQASAPSAAPQRTLRSRPNSHLPKILRKKRGRGVPRLADSLTRCLLHRRMRRQEHMERRHRAPLAKHTPEPQRPLMLLHNAPADPQPQPRPLRRLGRKERLE